MLYPAWREGLRRVLAAEPAPGKTFTHEWLYEAFGIEMPAPETPLKTAERAKMQYLSAFDAMREHLLTEHQIALDNIRGVGYRVVAPEEQTAWAEQDGLVDMRMSMRKMMLRMSNVDLAKLDADHRRQNADALARASMLSGMVTDTIDKRKRLLLGVGA